MYTLKTKETINKRHFNRPRILHKDQAIVLLLFQLPKVCMQYHILKTTKTTNTAFFNRPRNIYIKKKKNHNHEYKALSYFSLLIL